MKSVHARPSRRMATGMETLIDGNLQTKHHQQYWSRSVINLELHPQWTGDVDPENHQYVNLR